mmetsp:Transcript_42592/g.90130  ORF Transcript_42592/g.90130 Transcript_42592/m.90130 type:complete len:444 (-) Transcript_42592:59-1390(-)
MSAISPSNEIKVFVGKLSKLTQESDFEALFGLCPGLQECVLVRNKGTGEPTGCGFLKFTVLSDAVAAIQQYDQSVMLEDQTVAVQLRLSDKDCNKLGVPPQLLESGGEADVVVANLPADWTTQKTNELLGGYGPLLDVEHVEDARGFSGTARVKFSDARDALNAVAMLDQQLQLMTDLPMLSVSFAADRSQPPVPSKTGEWVCPSCNNLNFASRLACNRCKLDKQTAVTMQVQVRSGNGHPDEWTCPSCHNLNFASRLACNRCQLDKGAAMSMAEYATSQQSGGSVPKLTAAPGNLGLNRADKVQGDGRPGEWICPACSNLNFECRTSCNRCKIDKNTALSMMAFTEDDQEAVAPSPAVPAAAIVAAGVRAQIAPPAAPAAAPTAPGPVAGQPPPPPTNRRLGPWTEFVDTAGRLYYHNSVSGEVTWSPPPGLAPVGARYLPY